MLYFHVQASNVKLSTNLLVPFTCAWHDVILQQHPPTGTCWSGALPVERFTSITTGAKQTCRGVNQEKLAVPTFTPFPRLRHRRCDLI